MRVGVISEKAIVSSTSSVSASRTAIEEASGSVT
jgi:hypothetical protein